MKIKKNLSNKWNKIALKRKLFIILFFGVATPIIITALVLLSSLNQAEIQKIKETSQSILDTKSIEISSNIQVSQTAFQLIKINRAIIDFLNMNNITTNDMYEFKRIYAREIENIMASNPKICNIRVYYDNKNIPEMWPVFYEKSRIKNESWFNKLEFDKTHIIYDYTEKLSNYIGYVPQSGLIAFFNKIETDIDKNIIVEISMKMEDFFSQKNTVSKTQATAYLNNNNIYFDLSAKDSDSWIQIFNQIKTKIDFNNNESQIININNQSFLVSYKLESFLKGYILQVDSLNLRLADINNTRTYFIIALIVIALLSILTVNKVISLVLKRLYLVVGAMHEIEKGNLDVEVTLNQGDEISHLEFYFNKMAKKIITLMEQDTKRAIMEKDAQIRALQNQINSHFLYNTLENIKMMAELSNQHMISESVTALSKMLRYSMNWKSSNSKIVNEIEYVQNYLKIINMRYDYVITLSVELIDELEDLLLPKMTIQPIVENAVVHSIFKLQRDATIHIKMTADDTSVYISVTDEGVGMTGQEVELLNRKIKGDINIPNSGNTTGIGLRNVQERLELLFGGCSGIKVISDENKFTKVVVVIEL